MHLVDGRRHGALLLELFTRDGVGTMVARYNCSLTSITFYPKKLLAYCTFCCLV